jgi:transcriptional regulatory protein GAL4
MTALEARVERAEFLLRQSQLQNTPHGYRTVATAVEPPSAHRNAAPGSLVANLTELPNPAVSQVATAPLEQPCKDKATDLEDATLTRSTQQSIPDQGRVSASLLLQDHLTPPNVQTSTEDTEDLDNPYDVSGDFEWDESSARSPIAAPSGQASSEQPDEAELIGDGMATLAVDESQGAYLGVASCAALLRAIDQVAAHHSPKPHRSLRGTRSSSEIPMQLSSRRLVTNALVDAYFRHYHVSYPIIHEPTFRAQYDEVVERPSGPCWNLLAHLVAAIGAFTTGSDKAADNALFCEVKSLMNATYLENGNLTLVQALVLMSNYLQKQNMPNSGYNYMGLATRMAMGIGLHKEFRKKNTPPFKMEIRRRVWWVMTVFDIGAEITFSRPVLMPAGGFEVALPMNIHDWVSDLLQHAVS